MVWELLELQARGRYAVQEWCVLTCLVVEVRKLVGGGVELLELQVRNKPCTASGTLSLT